jgi:hypothetical protein
MCHSLGANRLAAQQHPSLAGAQSTDYVATLKVPEAAAVVAAASAVGDVSLAVIGGSDGSGASE